MWYQKVVPKGGIVAEVQTVEVQKILIQEAQNIFPGCISSTLSSPYYSIVVVKNFNPLISSEDIKRDIEEKYQTSCKIRSYHSYKNKKPLPIISIRTDKNNSELFLKEEILLLIKKSCVKHTNDKLFAASTVKNLDTNLTSVSHKISVQTVGDQ